MATPDINSDDYYQVLGVERSAGEKELLSAYKKLALRHHPDKNQGNKEKAEENFKKITEAYDVLRDPDKRKIYDQLGKVGLQSGPPPHGASADGNFRGGVHCASGFGSNGGGGQGMTREQADDIFRMFFGGRDPFSAAFAHPHDRDEALGGNFRFVDMLGMGMDIPNIMRMEIGASRGFCHGAGRSRGASCGARPGRGWSGPSSRGMQNFTKWPPHVLTHGANVVLRDLAKVPQHNGSMGKVVEWDDASARFKVALESPKSIVSVQRQNMTLLCGVTIDGLESKPLLNGMRGRICSYDSVNGRYFVQPEGASSATLALQPANCILPTGTAVILQGLSDVQYNGQMAVIVDVDRATRRYTVDCENGRTITVRYDRILC